MNIEIVEFYPLERNEDKEILTGTLRVKLPDIGIHILGIYISRRKDYWHFSLPGRNGFHHETQQPVRYPFIVFEDREKQRALMDAIREKGRDFIEHRLADTENPPVVPQLKQQQAKQVEHPKIRDNATDAKGTAFIAKPQPVKPTGMKQWVDPPKRKMQEAPRGKAYSR